MNLNDPIGSIKGIGKKRVEQFEKENIRTLQDLLDFIPGRYEDRTRLGSFNNIDQTVSIKAKVLKRGSIRYVRKNYNILVIPVEDSNNQKGEIIFFNQPYLINQFNPGQDYFFYGKVKAVKNNPKMYSPKFSFSSDKDFLKIIPIYKKINKIPASLIASAIEQILDNTTINDFLPEKYRNENNLLSLKEMYQSLHNPKDSEKIKKAINRIRMNEALKINAGVFSIKNIKEVTDLVISNFYCVESFIQNLPFELTNAQSLVLRDIFKDLESGVLMNRMIQGDVGSGKTIIAIICAYLFCLNGIQVAYMAPTEILAKQHFETFKEFFKDYNFKIELLVGSQPKKVNDQIREELKNGNINIAIGTHTLFQDSTDFYNLGLVITDEQHRFGVKQRGQLERKGSAHTLVMSATPIPRTLALTLFGDLDLSIIDELPKGRKRVKTSIHPIKKLNKIMKFIEEEIKNGKQAFIVCPFIEDSEEMKEVISVEKAYREINKKYGKKLKLEMLHSKLNNEEKEYIIQRFNKGEIDLLIATSIIEVGVNVPNVSVIVILNADRFGLSQLHQLRGRTGRSDIQSYCFLLSDNKNEISKERLKTIATCFDGQKIAEADLKLRGPGEYFGFEQHGYNNIKYLNPVDDIELFELSKNLIHQIFTSKKAEDLICKDYLIKAFNNDLKYITLD